MNIGFMDFLLYDVFRFIQFKYWFIFLNIILNDYIYDDGIDF